MPRTAASIAPDAIRIEEEVWQEAFDRPVPRPHRPRPAPAPAPARRAAPAPNLAPAPSAGPELRLVSAPSRPFDFAVDGADAAPAPSAAPTPPATTGTTAIPARRTVTIKGRGAERNMPWEAGISPRRSTRLPHHRTTFRPDRLAMWAVFLGLLLVIVAAMTAH